MSNKVIEGRGKSQEISGWTPRHHSMGLALYTEIQTDTHTGRKRRTQTDRHTSRMRGRQTGGKEDLSKYISI